MSLRAREAVRRTIASGGGQLHAIELAVEGRERGDEFEAASPVGGARRGAEPAGDIEHDLDEMGQGQLAGILAFGDFVKEFVEGCAVDDPVQGDSGDHRGRGSLDEGIEDGGQNQRSLLGRRVESQTTKVFTLENFRMFTGVGAREPTPFAGKRRAVPAPPMLPGTLPRTSAAAVRYAAAPPPHRQ